MAVFRWVGDANSLGTGAYQIKADWADLNTGVMGDGFPQTGDTADITGLSNSGIYKLGALYVFPVGSQITSVNFYPAQNRNTLLTNPNAVVGYTIQGQTINVSGPTSSGGQLGTVRLWLENSQLLSSTLNVTGTAVIASYLDSAVSGTVNVGSAAAIGSLQADIVPYDTSNVGPTDHDPVTTFNAAVNIGAGSVFDVEAGVAGRVTGFINNGTIDVAAGGTFVASDTDDPAIATDGFNVTFPSDHTMLFGNGGTIDVSGAPGAVTTAVLNTDVSGPGTIIVAGNGAARSATTLTLDGSVAGQAVSLTDGIVTVNDASTSIDDGTNPGLDITGGSFTFGDANGELVLHQAELTTLQFNADGTAMIEVPDGRMPFTTPIHGFGAGDVIALPGKNLSRFGSFDQAVYNAGTGVLQIESPAGLVGDPPEIVAALTFAGSYDAALFHLTYSPNEELDLTYGPACFCAGTAILTDHGEVAVDCLAIGDRVITHAGLVEPIRWIGRRSYAGRYLAGRRHLLPVLIRAGALGEGLPRRDLYVSPLHAMFLDGVLVPAGQLINATSIVQCDCDGVDYFHIELALHDVVFAEGAPCETFLDDDSRGMFQNAAEYVPALAAPTPCFAPRIESGFQLEAIRQRLAGGMLANAVPPDLARGHIPPCSHLGIDEAGLLGRQADRSLLNGGHGR